MFSKFGLVVGRIFVFTAFYLTRNRILRHTQSQLLLQFPFLTRNINELIWLQGLHNPEKNKMLDASRLLYIWIFALIYWSFGNLNCLLAEILLRCDMRHAIVLLNRTNLQASLYDHVSSLKTKQPTASVFMFTNTCLFVMCMNNNVDHWFILQLM